MKILAKDALENPNRLDTRHLDNRAILRDVQVRKINEKERSAVFVASTDNPVDTWLGPEILLMSGLDLERYEKNPVVLDSHNSYSVEKIIGRAEVKVKKHELEAKIFFAETALAENAWQLVKGEFLRALSVGFMRISAKMLEEGEEQDFPRDDITVNGPAVIVTAWELYEISAVPVPADADALKREYQSFIGKEGNMTKKADDKNKPQPAPEPAPTPEPPAVRATDVASGPVPAAAPADAEAKLAEERAKLETLKVVAEQIRTIMPRGMENEADLLVTQGKTLEEARARFQELMAERMKPVGTPPPENAPKQKPETEKPVDAKTVKEIFAS